MFSIDVGEHLFAPLHRHEAHHVEGHLPRGGGDQPLVVAVQDAFERAKFETGFSLRGLEG